MRSREENRRYPSARVVRPPARGLVHALFLLSLFLSLPCFADKVTIRWQEIPRASGYRLEIRHENNIVVGENIPATRRFWKGSLSFGWYDYRIRPMRDGSAAGTWSRWQPFLVTPPAPQPILPPNRSTVVFDPGKGVLFQWRPIEGVKKYALEIKSKDGVKSFMAGDVSLVVDSLKPGSYEWKVKPVVESDRSTASADQSQIINTRSSQRSVFQLEDVGTVGRTWQPYLIDVGAGLLAATKYVLPTFHVGASLTRSIAIELVATYANDPTPGASLRTIGFVTAVDYYFLHGAFSGPFVEAGLGVYLFTGNNGVTEESMRPALTGSVDIGWRQELFFRGLNVGVAAGAQYIAKPDVTVVQFDSFGTFPFFRFDISFGF